MKIDGQVVARSLLLRQVKHKVENFVNLIGETRLRYLLEKDKSFSDYIPERQIKQYITDYSKLAGLITDEQLKEMLPVWALNLISERGEKGREWLDRNLAWIKGIIARR